MIRHALPLYNRRPTSKRDKLSEEMRIFLQSSATLLQQFHNLVVSTPGRPGQRRGPRRIVGQVRLGAATEKEFHHLGPPEFRGPAQRRGADVFVARVQVGAVVEEPGGFLHVPTASEMMQ